VLASVMLSLDPGQYWLAVVPVGTGSGANPTVSGTLGSNCVGLPCGNDGKAFYYTPSNAFFQFYPTTSFSPDQRDYSFGVLGTVGVTGTPAPEPGSFIPLLLAFAVFLVSVEGVHRTWKLWYLDHRQRRRQRFHPR
jgi:hypothetical protein